MLLVILVTGILGGKYISIYSYLEHVIIRNRSSIWEGAWKLVVEDEICARSSRWLKISQTDPFGWTWRARTRTLLGCRKMLATMTVISWDDVVAMEWSFMFWVGFLIFCENANILFKAAVEVHFPLLLCCGFAGGPTGISGFPQAASTKKLLYLKGFWVPHWRFLAKIEV